RELPQLPDFRQMPLPPHWACGHDSLAASYADGAAVSSAIAPAPGPGVHAQGPPGEVPAGPAGTEAGPPPPSTGSGRASPSLSPVSPPAMLRAADRTKSPPAPPSSPDGGLTAWLQHWRATVIDSAAQTTSYFGAEENPDGQAPLHPAAALRGP